jgi:hypothetical protein
MTWNAMLWSPTNQNARECDTTKQVVDERNVKTQELKGPEFIDTHNLIYIHLVDKRYISARDCTHLRHSLAAIMTVSPMHFL